FFLITISIFAITSEEISNPVAVIWACLTFSILLAGSQFQKDFEDGSFEQLILSGSTFEIIILAKILSNWLCNSLPLIIILPIISILLGLENGLILHLLVISIIATLIINFLISFGSSLTLSSNQTNSLLTILVLPLIIPILIFANSSLGGDFEVSIKFLLALLVFLVPILTISTAAAVKVNVVD
ncbi:MAG: heme exporter protein B, partial [Lentimonas sp.]